MSNCYSWSMYFTKKTEEKIALAMLIAMGIVICIAMR